MYKLILQRKFIFPSMLVTEYWTTILYGIWLRVDCRPVFLRLQPYFVGKVCRYTAQDAWLNDYYVLRIRRLNARKRLTNDDLTVVVCT
jgi:hypothetical protein